jgi:hypothetical protein
MAWTHLKIGRREAAKSVAAKVKSKRIVFEPAEVGDLEPPILFDFADADAGPSSAELTSAISEVLAELENLHARCRKKSCALCPRVYRLRYYARLLSEGQREVQDEEDDRIARDGVLRGVWRKRS